MTATTPAGPDIRRHESSVTRPDRPSTGRTIWFTGLSGSGKSTLAFEVERILNAGGRPAYVLDGDNLRHGLNDDLGFGAAERTENVRRVAHVAALFSDAGVIALVPLVSPYRLDRDGARKVHDDAGLPFHEVFVDTPLTECERRDPKGLYARARRGELASMTGIDDPYEAPLEADLHLVPVDGAIERTARAVIAATIDAPPSERRPSGIPIDPDRE